MKKYLILLFSAILVFGVSCTDESMDFDTNGGKGLAFTHFVGSAQTLVAKPGAYTTTIKISSTVKTDAARSYNLVVSPTSTAIEGTHYTLSSKTITIPAGQFEGSVTLTANADKITPETVTARFTVDSEDFIDYGKTMTVNMYLFFEVTWDWLVGTWNWVDDEWSGEVKVAKVNDNTMSISNIWDYGMSIDATVDFANAKISIKPAQKFCMNYIEDGVDYKGLFLCAITGDTYTSYSRTEPIIGTCSYTGTISFGRWTPMLLEAGYYWGAFYTNTMSKK